MQFWKKLGFFYGFCLFNIPLFAEPLKFEAKGEAAILMNADTGVILFDYQAFTPQYPASTTKVATALYALKLRGDELDIEITAARDSVASLTQEAKRKSNYKVPSYWIEPDSMHIGIKAGEVMTLRTLLEGMLIPSGNDAANVIAQGLAPSIPLFMEQLNAYLKEIGCEKTHFCNPHGLHDPQHVTTAYDLALMAREALKYPLFCEIVAKPRFFRPKTNKQAAVTLLQTNRLIRPGQYYYSKAIGIKTGWHAKAKKAFVAAARADGRTLIAVLLGYKVCETVFEEAKALFEMAFNQPKVQKQFLKSGPQTFTLDLPQSDSILSTYLSEPVSLEYYPAENPQAKCLLYWNSLSLPIEKDQTVAELRLVSSKGETIKQFPLLAANAVELAWPYRLLSFFSSPFGYFFIGATLFLVVLTIVWKKFQN